MISRKLSVILLAMVFIIGAVGSAHAYGSYLTAFNSTYGTSGTALNTCGVCHVDPAGGGTRNSYGKAFEAVPTHSSNPAGAFATIGSQASACSGYTYLQLINLGINPGNGSCPTPPVACTGYTYSAWSACGTNGQQTRTVTGNTPSGCTGTPPSAAVLTQACTPPPVACTGYTYSAWSACGTDGQQTRTVTGNTPSGCTGTPPSAAVLTQACTSPPVACTGYTYSAWSACGTDGQQTRTVTGNTPSGCTGTPPTAAVLTQACTPPPPTACTGYTYSAWSACGTDGQQTRTVTGNTPSGCTGTPPTAAVLTQACLINAGPVDGLWVIIDSEQVPTNFAMLRESSGELLITSLASEMNDWQAFFGPFDGTTSQLTTLASRWEQLSLTCTFLTPDSASCTITGCTSTGEAQCKNGIIGQTFTLQKMF